VLCSLVLRSVLPQPASNARQNKSVKNDFIEISPFMLYKNKHKKS